MKIRPLNTLLNVVVLIFLANCSSLPERSGESVPAMTFNHVQPIALDVSTHDVALRRHVDHVESIDFIKPLDAVVESYFRSKVTPHGADGAFRVEIHDASVKRNHVKAGREMARFLGVFGLDEYILNVEALLVLERPELRKTVKMQAGRVVRVSEHSSIANRERDQLVALEELLRALDVEFTRVMRAEYGDYIR